MSTKPPRKPRRKHMRLLAFAPTLVCIGVVAFLASGASIVPGATAVTTVGVTGTVSTTFSVDPPVTSGSGATGCDDETLTAFASAFAASNGCTVSINTNNVNGANVTFENALSGGNNGQGFFCADPDGAGALPRDCGTLAQQENRLENVTGTNQAISSDNFGLALKSVGGSGSPVAGAGAPTMNPTSAAASGWNQIPAAGAGVALCRTSAPNTTDATCNFAFGGRGSGASQGAGTYSGSLRLISTLL